MSVEIRPAAPGDAAALTELAFRSKAHWGYDDAFMEACRSSLTVHGTCVEPTFIAEREGMVAGFYQLDGDEVDKFFVDPPHIGSGVGRALWEHLVETARDHGLSSITILSDPNAKGFYEAMGARSIGDAPSDVFGPSRPLPLLVADVAAPAS